MSYMKQNKKCKQTVIVEKFSDKQDEQKYPHNLTEHEDDSEEIWTTDKAYGCGTFDQGQEVQLEPVWGPCAIVPILVKYSILTVSISTQNYNKITR